MPTLVLHSKDDPIVSVDCVPIDECLANPNIIIALTRRGGHVCYFSEVDGGKRWYAQASSEFLKTTLDKMQKEQRQ